MVADRVGDFGGQSLGAGVVAAHQALQLRELANHLGDEVGLGEARGLFGEVGEASTILPIDLRWGGGRRISA